MSRKKIQNNTNSVLERIRAYYHLDNGDEALAAFFDVEKNTISAWRQRDSIPVDKIIISVGYENLRWFYTGEGPVSREEKTETPAINEQPAVYTTTAEKHADVFTQVREILESGDDFVIKALKDRLKDYRLAVGMNAERRSLQQRLTLLEKDVKAIKERPSGRDIEEKTG